MDPTTHELAIRDAAAALVGQWGVSHDAALHALSLSAAAFGLGVEELAAMVNASTRRRSGWTVGAGMNLLRSIPPRRRAPGRPPGLEVTGDAWG